MSYVDASAMPELPLEPMNADHAQELALLEQLGKTLDAQRRGESHPEDVLERLALLAVHTREHFLREEQLMRESRFAGYAVHKAEHDRVLAEMDQQARTFRETNDGERLSRYLLEVVPAWYVSHTRTMDVAAARHAADARR
jgi:hemerythrin